MGQTFPDFQTAQKKALDYALSERAHQRWAFGYVFAAIFSAIVLLIIEPKLIIPSLIVSSLSYGLFRYGGTMADKMKSLWASRQSESAQQRDSARLKPLLTVGSNLVSLHGVANHELNLAIEHKATRVKYYQELASLSDQLPLSYYDHKHKRALFQYKMLQTTQNSAYQGQGNFLTFMAEERAERRQKKINMLKLIKEEFIDTGKLSICLKYITSSSAGKCTLGGDKTAQSELLSRLKALNNEGSTPLVHIPSHHADLEIVCILDTLLPVLFDMDNVLQEVMPHGPGRVVIETQRDTLIEYTYAISADVLDTRIKKLEQTRQGVLDQFAKTSFKEPELADEDIKEITDDLSERSFEFNI